MAFGPEGAAHPDPRSPIFVKIPEVRNQDVDGPAPKRRIHDLQLGCQDVTFKYSNSQSGVKDSNFKCQKSSSLDIKPNLMDIEGKSMVIDSYIKTIGSNLMIISSNLMIIESSFMQFQKAVLNLRLCIKPRFRLPRHRFPAPLGRLNTVSCSPHIYPYPSGQGYRLWQRADL